MDSFCCDYNSGSISTYFLTVKIICIQLATVCMKTDVVGASYYDSSLRWFENDGTGVFTEHLISSAVNEGQGVILADLDSE